MKTRFLNGLNKQCFVLFFSNSGMFNILFSTFCCRKYFVLFNLRKVEKAEVDFI